LMNRMYIEIESLSSSSLQSIFELWIFLREVVNRVLKRHSISLSQSMSWSVIFGAVLFLSVFLSFVSCYGADCSNQTVGWSDYCYNIDNKAPYCHRSFNASPIAICVACQTDCDCDIHEYCSTNPSVRQIFHLYIWTAF
jgi:hypothetical protein